MKKVFSATFILLLLATSFAATWQSIKPILSPRQEFPGVYLDGKIYIAGGMNSNNCCNALKNFEVYDIAKNEWKALADLPHGVNHPGIATVGGKVYVIGGYIVKNTPTDRAFEFDPSKGSWKEIAKMKKKTANPGVCVYKGKIWVFGGHSDAGWDKSSHKDVQVYDPSTSSWSIVNSSNPNPKCHIGVGIVDGKAYISPGRPSRLDNTCEEFDFAKADKGADAWRKLETMPSDPRTGMVSTWPVVDGKLYYIGGETKSSALKTIHVFDPKGGTKGKWTKFSPSYPSGLHGVGPIAVGGKIYVMGGGTSVNVTGRTDKSYVITLSSSPVALKPVQSMHRNYTQKPHVMIFHNGMKNSSAVYTIRGERIKQTNANSAARAPRLIINEH